MVTMHVLLLCVVFTLGVHSAPLNITDWPFSLDTSNLQLIPGTSDYYKTHLNINATIRYRLKSPSSILNKFKRKNRGVIPLHDLIAYKVIVDTVDEAYIVNDVFNEMYPPKVYKDFILNPKPCGYKSIHFQSEIKEINRTVELQIRTWEMEEFDSYQHAIYKDQQSWQLLSNSTDLMTIPEIASAIENVENECKKFDWTLEKLTRCESDIGDLWNLIQNRYCSTKSQINCSLNENHNNIYCSVCSAANEKLGYVMYPDSDDDFDFDW